MKFMASLFVVTDIERSRKFYQDVLGLVVTEDFGANITFNDSFSLQTHETWLDFIEKPESDVLLGHHASELYFEEENFDAFIDKLNARTDIELVHSVKEHSWGQRSIRFYDPDHHIIEVGETMHSVVGRFLAQGLSVEQTAQRMDVSIDYIKENSN